MNKQDRKQSLVLQAGILAGAGIIVRLIGLFYNTPLVHIIGDEGFGYYDSAYAAYSIVLLISSFSIPSAISKVMAQRLAQKEYRNAYRIFKCTLLYVFVVGIIAGLFVFFGAGLLVKMDSAILPLKILAPTIFFSGFLGAFRGFFQAQHSMVQTSISQIIEQIFNAAFSIWMAYILVNQAAGLPASTVASYGAAGSTIGTGAGVLAALGFMIFLFFFNKPYIMKKVEEDTHEDESYKDILKMILLVVTPFILSTGIYNINMFLDKYLYQAVLMKRGLLEGEVAFGLSAYAKANKIANIPIALSAAMGATLIPRISGNMAQGKQDAAKAQVDKATRVTMYISIPAMIGICVLAKPVMMFIFPQKESLDLASAMLIILGVTVVLYGLSTITQSVLQAMGKLNTPIINAAISLIIHAVIMVAVMMFVPTDYAVYVYGGATIIYALILCILNGISVKKYLNYDQEIDKTFMRPLICSIAMGVVVFLIYQGLYRLTKINILALLISVAIGAVVYFVLTVKWKAISEEELKAMPKGELLLKVARKLKLI